MPNSGYRSALKLSTCANSSCDIPIHCGDASVAHLTLQVLEAFVVVTATIKTLSPSLLPFIPSPLLSSMCLRRMRLASLNPAQQALIVSIGCNLTDP